MGAMGKVSGEERNPLTSSRETARLRMEMSVVGVRCRGIYPHPRNDDIREASRSYAGLPRTCETHRRVRWERRDGDTARASRGAAQTGKKPKVKNASVASAKRATSPHPPSPHPLPHLLQQRFTEKAIKVVMLAQEEARRLGHNFVGTEQVSRCAALYARARPPAPPTPPHTSIGRVAHFSQQLFMRHIVFRLGHWFFLFLHTLQRS
jgi:hypothetical protein